ncbi:NADH/Ubiquinone/plastoquinone (complex I) [Arcobacter nitrofigilis DSM 7299]|uniref:NADH/Ubiquinone/plastoquinone (Complex I) n=1 Tax=Arcobacter nitrofigilis (strain ATCC 33309 / DSM 7299 / CCUG 15893 / LMG 7604 / NCTC 12251 / CI) TaxID=572480 RepID=D5V2G6_ARCNC|nr:hydrogenase 4 subunit F [Arcobacter nitrofigilis]ADG92399.1 NADH/Ubiquinone/plastoquinone (complex I) [Arcobacter nitrofigilis DSM 7299]
MDMQQLLILLMLIPLVSSVVIWLCADNYKALSTLHIIASILTTIVGLMAVSNVINGTTYFLFNDMFFLDSLGAVFISLIAVTGLLVNLYSVKYMQWEVENKHLEVKDTKLFFSLFHLFVFTMTFSVLSNNIALMWVGIEATTLSSVFMVALHKSSKSTETGWKYIVICSIGLAFALYATVLLYSAGFNVINDSHSAMLWTTLMAHSKDIDQDALKLIFVFALIGFGTKAGLAPTHTWLPDVHAEGPAPSSAMLSGILLKCAILGLIRYYAIVGNSFAGFEYVQTMMIFSGLITIFIASFFLLVQHDVKRMFAYHSIAHMGVIAFGLGIGGPIGLFAALFHTLAHSVTKALAFCVTGNMIQIYGTRDMRKMGGLIKIAPITAILFGIAVCSLVGVPGFAIFFSEFLMIKQSIVNNMNIEVILFIIGLIIIFIADFSHFNLATFGESNSKVLRKELPISANLPLIGLAALIIIFGLFTIEPWFELLRNAVNIIMGM